MYQLNRKLNIFGRSALVCDSEANLSNLIANQWDNSNSLSLDQFYLWHPHIHNCEYQSTQAGFNVSYAGCLLLEGLKKQATTRLKLLPFGVLHFTCSPEERNKILKECKFSYADILNNTVRIQLFSIKQILHLEDYITHYHNGLCYNWTGLRQCLLQMTNDYSITVTSAMHITNACIVQKWHAVSFLKKWLETCAKIPTIVAKISQKTRGLHTNEYVWLFIQVGLRYCYHASTPMHIIRQILCCTYLDSTLFPITTNCETSESNHSANYTLHQINQSTMIGCDISLTDVLLSTYGDLHTTLNETMKITRLTVGNKLDDVRQKYSLFPLFTSYRLNSLTTEIIKLIPVNLFDLNAVYEWCTRVDSMIKEEFSAEQIYTSVYKNAKAFSTKNGFLKLYGNAQSLLHTLLPEQDHKFDYTVENIGKLSDSEIKDLTPYGLSKHYSNLCTFDYENSNVRGVCKRLLEAAHFTVPIWATRKTHSMHYMRLIPRTTNQASTQFNTGTLDHLLSEYMYNERAADGTNGELLNSALHFSAFIADVDFQLADCQMSFDRTKFANDLISMTDRVFKHIFGFVAQNHYIYCSKMEGDDTKHGFHQHSILPNGVVFSSQVCSKIAQIFNLVRHSYPDTLGVSILNANNNMFDCSIYPKFYGTTGCTGHLLRGPNQCQLDGKRKLECILKTAPITLHSKLAHAPQIVNGKPTIFGTIYTDIVNLTFLNDESFIQSQESKLIVNHINTTCFTNPQNIMEEINKRVYLFHNPKNYTLLLNIVNELWATSGSQMLCAHMNTATGTNGVTYNSQDIADIKHKLSKFNYNPTTNSINLMIHRSNTYNNPGFCLLRPHLKPINQSGTTVCIMYNAKMIRFVIRCRCFKASCHGKSILPNVFLTMNHTFITKSLQTSVMQCFSKFLDSHINLYEINGETDPISLVQPVHQGRGVNIYSNAQGCNVKIQYLYMYIQHNNITYLVVRIFPNRFVACIHYPSKANSLRTYTCTNHKDFLNALQHYKVIPMGMLEKLENIFKSQH